MGLRVAEIVNTPSPIYFAIKPSNRLTSSATHRWYDPITSRISSGSSRDDIGVDPTRSQNMTVSWRRSASPPTEASDGGEKPATMADRDDANCDQVIG